MDIPPIPGLRIATTRTQRDINAIIENLLAQSGGTITITAGETGRVTKAEQEYTIDSKAYVGTDAPEGPWEGMLRVSTGI